MIFVYARLIKQGSSTCRKCLKAFTSLKKLDEHRKACHICDKQFTTRSAARRHEREVHNSGLVDWKVNFFVNICTSLKLHYFERRQTGKAGI